MKRQVFIILGVLSLTSCDVYKTSMKEAKLWVNYEKAALTLAKENRELKLTIEDLKYDLQKVKAEQEYSLTDASDSKARGIASVAAINVEKDLVQFKTYRWSPSELIAKGNSEFKNKNYEKSAQFFKTLAAYYPETKLLNDRVLFQAGLAAVESGKHSDWAIEHFSNLIEKYPTSDYFRGAKLWTALTHLKEGKKDQFFSVAEEFRKKYRNTKEWKVLSPHYEKIIQNYK